MDSAPAREVSRRAVDIFGAGWPNTSAKTHREFEAFDSWLRHPANRFNPGTTADLVTAALYAALRNGIVNLAGSSAIWEMRSAESMVISPAFTSLFVSKPDCRSPMDLPAMSSSLFRVRVTKDYLVFCSGHFITYDGDHCERIHGHNYRTAVEVEGDLDQNHYVIDFIALKDLTPRSPTSSITACCFRPGARRFSLHEDGPNMRVNYRDRYWSFPRNECDLLPVANTTAELLANYIAGRLREAMTARGWELPRIVRVEVEESFGQAAQVEWRRDVEPPKG